MDGTNCRAHIGNHNTSIALQEPHLDADENQTSRLYKDHGVNHLAFVVSDIDACAARLDGAGFRRSTATKEHTFRKRLYFFERAGLEWELVRYLTDIMADRHSS